MAENIYTTVHFVCIPDPKAEEYRQNYQDALDEIQRLDRIIDELREELYYSDLANSFLSEIVDNLTDEVSALYVKLHNLNN